MQELRLSQKATVARLKLESRTAMYVSFDVFQKGPGGSVLWVGAASSKAEAEKIVTDAMTKVPCDYLIFRSDTQESWTIYSKEPAHQ